MNPYQPPSPFQNQPYQMPNEHVERLKRIAFDQRMINFVVLAYLGVGGMNTSMAAETGQEAALMRIIIGFVALFVIIAGVVFAVRMASALHGTVIAVLCAVSLIIPCVGLIVLLVLNSQATRVLRNAGLKVGLLGVDSSQFRNWR
ncbi:MAG: hypothetical protein IPK82_42600 [Polyangiaceae bacterium]|nr:hypothetical protein [Polyangiaceae bacterium]